MSESSTKVATVLALTLAALAVPCGAWYVVGSRGVRQEARRLLEAPTIEAQETADDLARRLTTLLDELRIAESARPFQHYTHQYHGTAGDCACPAPVTSPLATGRSNPLIAAHFQIDDQGRISLPTLGGEIHSESQSVWHEEQHALLDLLASAAPSLGTGNEDGRLIATPVIYTEEDFRAEFCDRPPEQLITLGPFRWRTLRIGGEPMLAALREVSTDRQNLTQGFLVATEALEEYVEAAPYPVRLLEGSPSAPGESALQLGGPEWRVVVDADRAIASAEADAQAARSRFFQVFLLGTFAAIVAGLAIVGVVWQIERLSTARARFAAAAAHELRSPLAGIRLYGDMLAEQLGKPEKTREYARKLSHEAQQLGRVVGNVLGYSRLERGPLPLHPEPGDIRGAVLASVERLGPSLEASGARLDVSVETDIPAISFDRDAVHHIVQNLVDNAEKFSRDADDRTIHVRLATSGSGVSLSVADHGPGIPSRERRRVFRPFAGGAGNEGHTGLGLGLVLVRALVEAHRGSVRYDPTPGGGATFTIVLPG